MTFVNSKSLLAAVLVLVLGWTGSAWAANSAEADALARRAIQRELKNTSGQGPHWAYRLHRQTHRGSQVKELVQTREGIVARWVEVNGRPLTAEERRKDEERLNTLLSNPEEQRKNLREQQQEAERVRKLLADMPNAFHYEFDGSEAGPHGQMIRLRFKPNPNYSASSRETLIFQAMEGTMWVDAAEERVVRISGTLKDSVRLGWGLVAYLDPGGKFEIQQSRLPDGHWMISRMRLDFNGRALLVRRIRIDTTQTITNYRQVPKDLSLAAGIEMLREKPSAVSASAAGK